jgi:chemotaxis family two-component system response regulator Rcp1
LSQKEKGKAPPSASPSPQENSTPKIPVRKLNIIIVEDNASDVFLAEEALAYHNIDATLTCHRDGEEMLRYIDNIDAGMVPCPDVVLLDLNLPRHNGKAVLVRMRKSLVCGHVPVVVVTSSKAVEDQADAARLGATRYFFKSMDYDEAMSLGSVVLEVLQPTNTN